MAYPAAILAAFSEVLRELYAAPSSTAGLLAILPGLERMFHSRWVVADELPRIGPPIFHGCTNLAEIVARITAYPAYAHELPTVKFVRAGGWAPVYRLLEFASDRDLRRTNIFSGIMRPIGMRDQLGLAFRAPGCIGIGITCNRDLPFTDDERFLAKQLQPHLQSAVGGRRVQELASRQSLEIGRWQAPVDAGGRSDFIPAGMHDLLKRYFPAKRREGKTVALPDEVRRWVAFRARQLLTLGAGTPPLAPWEIVSARGCLRLTLCLAGSERRDLVLGAEESRGGVSLRGLRGLGLSTRECDVAFWIVQGKRDAEIAQILGTARRTVSKHVERVLAKLGAEHRQSAAHVVRRSLTGGAAGN